MQNYLHLIQGSSYEALTHGGPVTRRRFALYVNGVFIRRMDEGSGDMDWSHGSRFDKIMSHEVGVFEEALKCRCIRGRLKDATL